MSIQNSVICTLDGTQILQWTGNNFDEIRTWLKDLNRDINLDISEADSPSLEIPDLYDGILRVNIYEYITRDLDNIMDTLPPSQVSFFTSSVISLLRSFPILIWQAKKR